MRRWMGARLDRLRLRLSQPEALLQLALMGLLSGLLAGAVVVLFRLVVEGAQAGLLPHGIAENYEQLAVWQRVLFPLLGALLVALVFQRFARGDFAMGIPRLLERMAYHQGYFSLRSLLLQFFGSATAIISGHSVGREGPHIFLGAATASLLGQRLALPNNSIRTLVGCGTAAGIAASFNTPLAGVIFALEVVMLEYTLSSFIPVILAAVSATTLSNLVLGDSPAFMVPQLQLGSFQEIPLVILLGLLAGAVSAAFNRVLEFTTEETTGLPFWQRMALAGMLMAFFALLFPQVMGIGYDTVDQILHGKLALWLLLLLVCAKLAATSLVIGLGMPGGVIGPTLFIGAALGGSLANIATALFPQYPADPALYALIGMGAMMGASFQAPLAALTAMMELTYSPQLIMPGMLAIVVAGLTLREVFHKESLFISLLRANGLDYNTHPVMQALRRTGVAGVMSDRFVRCNPVVGSESARLLLESSPEWILIQGEKGPVSLMPAVDLARYLQKHPEELQLDLLAIPGQRQDLARIHLQATLQEALEELEQTGRDALYVDRMTAPGIYRVYGVLTREQVESAYRL